MVNQTIKHIRAFDNFSSDKRVVLNYTSASKETDGINRSTVSSFFVYCKQNECSINMRDFQLKNAEGDNIRKYESKHFTIEYIGKVGQREILFQTKFTNDSVKILFLNRNKSVRVIQNTFDNNQTKGALFKRTLSELPNIKYIERI